MTDSDDFARMLLEEIRILRSEMASMRESQSADIADLKAHVERLRLNESRMERENIAFWAERWGPLKSDLQDIKNRLGIIEQKDVTELERRVDKLEQNKAAVAAKLHSAEEQKLHERIEKLERNENRRLGVLAGVAMAGGGGVASLIEFLSRQ